MEKLHVQLPPLCTLLDHLTHKFHFNFCPAHTTLPHPPRVIPVYRPSIHPPIHPSACPPYPSSSPLSHALSSFCFSLQECGEQPSPSPTSCSTFYYSAELPEPRPPAAAPAGAQPHAGLAAQGQLPGPAAVEAERRAVCDAAAGPLPPLAAGDAAAVQVMEAAADESPWKRRSEAARMELVDGGAQELSRVASESSDLQMTLIWWWWWWWRLTISKGHNTLTHSSAKLPDRSFPQDSLPLLFLLLVLSLPGVNSVISCCWKQKVVCVDPALSTPPGAGATVLARQRDEPKCCVAGSGFDSAETDWSSPSVFKTILFHIIKYSPDSSYFWWVSLALSNSFWGYWHRIFLPWPSKKRKNPQK